MAALSPELTQYLLHCWPLIGRPAQQPPALAQDGGDWTTWLMLGGRGAGKTRAGAEWCARWRPGLEARPAGASR